MVFDSSAYSEMNSLGNVAMVKDISERDKMFDSRGWDAARFERLRECYVRIRCSEV